MSTRRFSSFEPDRFAPPLKTLYFLHQVAHPDKILVIRFSSIGDIVLATPLLRILRSRFPSAQIDFIVRKEFSELIRSNKNLSAAVEFNTIDGFGGLRKLKNRIRTERYDLIVDIHNSLRSRYLRLMSGARDVVVINKRVFARTMLVRFKRNFYKDAVSVSDRYIETVKKYGIENDNAGLELFIPAETKKQVSETLAGYGIGFNQKAFGLCPSAKHTTKCWPAERFIEIGTELAKWQNARILIFGGTEDMEKCKLIADAINLQEKGRAIDLSGKFSLLGTAAAVEFCDIIVTNDSGLMHIACAVKKKVIAVFGPTVREFGFFPVNKDSIVIEQPGLYCRPCSHIGLDACPEGHFRCMKDIKTEDVLRKIKG
jgi:lipopolysaccharide heptosyltransferase II